MLHRRELFAREKRGDAVGKTKRGKGTKWLVVADGQGIPLGVSIASASPAEITLVQQTLATVSVPRPRGGAGGSAEEWRAADDTGVRQPAVRDDHGKRVHCEGGDRPGCRERPEPEVHYRGERCVVEYGRDRLGHGLRRPVPRQRKYVDPNNDREFSDETIRTGKWGVWVRNTPSASFRNSRDGACDDSVG